MTHVTSSDVGIIIKGANKYRIPNYTHAFLSRDEHSHVSKH